MTEKQLLSIPFTTWTSDEGKQELSREAGEVLREKHTPFHPQRDFCVRCLQKLDEGFCPIPLTWQEAMKWRDWAVEKFGHTTYKQAMLDVKQSNPARKTLPFDLWLAGFAQAYHYILAAVLCEIRSKQKT